MKAINKVFGIGMSKTGTTTVGTCLEMLGFIPHIGFEPQLKQAISEGKELDHIMRVAERYRAFEDSPWYLIYRELDIRFPGSKFILTVRRDSLTHARSSWAHGVRRGQRAGEPSEEYLREKIRVYETHNAGVLEYFKDRPDDLLVLCWENGDGWEKLCPFLGVPVPTAPIPHQNQGRYKSLVPDVISTSRPYSALIRGVHQISLTPTARKLKQFLGYGLEARNEELMKQSEDRASSSSSSLST